MRTAIKALLALGLVAGAATLAIPDAGAAKAQGFYIDAPNVHVRVGHPHHWYYRHRGMGRMPLTLAIPTATTTITAIGGAARPITQSKAAFVSRIEATDLLIYKKPNGRPHKKNLTGGWAIRRAALNNDSGA
jgi:hypothetical protein